jgi:hypothetical protein
VVLTLQGAGKQLKPLAMGAVSSGGSSGSGKLVPAILLTIKERERAHERPGHGRNVKQSPVGCDTHWNTVATGRVPRRRSRPELEKREKLWRLRGLGRELGGALGPQGDGEYGSVLNLARGELGTVDFRERDVEFLRPWTANTDGVVHVGAQVEGKASPRHPRRLATLAASSCVHSRMRAALLARQLRWTGSR